MNSPNLVHFPISGPSSTPVYFPHSNQIKTCQIPLLFCSKSPKTFHIPQRTGQIITMVDNALMISPPLTSQTSFPPVSPIFSELQLYWPLFGWFLKHMRYNPTTSGPLHLLCLYLECSSHKYPCSSYAQTLIQMSPSQ